MFKAQVTSNVDDELKRFVGFERQLPFATALALTRTAQDVKRAEEAAIRTAFDRPTPYTMRSVFMRPATKQRLEAVVWLKDERATEGTPATAYLGPQVYGGERGLKRFERSLVKVGHMKYGDRAVPAAAARLDSYGNMSRGQIVQILSQLKANTLAGYDANATNSRRSRAKRVVEQYFVSGGPGSRRTTFGSQRFGRGTARQHLPAGVWVRRQTSWGTAVKPVLLFVSAAQYRQRLDFFGVAKRVVDATFPGHFARAADQALRTARSPA